MQKIKILCLADLHNSTQALRAINNHLSKNKYDLVLCAGDVISRPNKNAPEFLKEFINIITKLHQTKLLMIHGNNEDEAMIDFLRKEKVFIHLVVKKVKGYKIYGIGGWMEDVTSVDDIRSKIADAILVTHLPPKKLPKAPNASTKKVLGPSPKVHLCAHIHGPGAIWRIGETLVIKLPSAMYNKAAILEMPGRKIKFIDL